MKKMLQIKLQFTDIKWLFSALPCERKTRSSASWEKGMPVDFSSFKKASFRVGGWTALLFRIGLNKTNHSGYGFYTMPFIEDATNKQELLLTAAGVLCCRLAPNVLSIHSLRPGMIIPLSLYLDCVKEGRKFELPIKNNQPSLMY